MQNEEDPVAVGFRDILLGYVGLLASLVLVLLVYVNDPTEDSAMPPGQQIISIFWPEGPADIDLWLLGPDDERVFYNNKQGLIWNLLRDDVGISSDLMPNNYENAYSRGSPEGEYWINVVCFSRCPAPIEVVIVFEMNINGKVVKIAEKKVKLNYDKDWVTGFHYYLDKDGKPYGLDNEQFDVTQGIQQP